MHTVFREAIKGINAIPVTPFDERGNIDWDAYARVLDDLIGSGLAAIYPCGNTGEFYSLSVDEAKEVVTFAVRQAAGRAKVIAGIGYDAGTAAELARHAESAGADGAMVHQPVHPFVLESGLVEYYRAIARATKLPVVLYARSETVTVEVLNQAASEANIVGVKYALNHLPSFAKAVRAIGERYVWLCGTAEMWAPFFFAAGAVGFTSGMVNVDARRSFAMLDVLREGRYDRAMELWEEIRPFEELRETRRSGNNVSVVKEAMAQLGKSNGVLRPPAAPLAPEEKREVRRILASWGLLP